MIKKMLILIGFILPLQIFAQNEIWVARYDGEANDYDGAFAMAVDDSGYIYVTGGSCDTSAMGWGDYATIKYNSAGDTLWVRRYNGPKNTADEAYAIAVDKNGNVYVTGRSCGIGTDYDYATIKYNSAGSEMWVRRYDRGGGAGYNDDEASAITVDDSKNVYVTGRFETIKYDSLGDTMWVRVFDGEAYAITVDNVKNVYVTGISAGSYDYLTIKYNSSGDTVWVRRYNGTGKGHKVINGYEEPKGDNYYKIKGIRKGLGGTGGVAIAVDNNGNVYVTGKNNNSGNTSSDYATIKYNSLGDTMWGRRYHGPDSTGWDGATALSIDNNGNVYVTGRSCDSGTDYDYATIKYDGSGDTLWVKKYSGPTKGNNCGTGIVVDNSGNVYVTGCSWGGGDSF